MQDKNNTTHSDIIDSYSLSQSKKKSLSGLKHSTRDNTVVVVLNEDLSLADIRHDESMKNNQIIKYDDNKIVDKEILTNPLTNANEVVINVDDKKTKDVKMTILHCKRLSNLIMKLKVHLKKSLSRV